MKKEELEKKIENEEVVWYAILCNGAIQFFIKEIQLDKNYFIEFKEKFGTETNQYVLFKNDVCDGYNIKNIFSTRGEAEDYVNSPNVTKTETQPPITWDEFKKVPYLLFANYNFYGDYKDSKGSYHLCIVDNKLLLRDDSDIDLEEWEATEENFYKAYDYCKKLFLGEI